MKSAGKIAVITDTCGDLPQEVFKNYPIFCVPLVVACGETSYRDNIDITVEEVYRRQKTETFKTSLPFARDIADTLDAVARQGYTQVIVLVLAECLSGEANLFRLAAQERGDLEIAVFDTKNASLGEGIVALQVADYARGGMPFDRLKKVTARLVEETTALFSLDTLEYLRRGGRIGRVTALAGSLLQIKPILTFDHRDGVISTVAKVRGRKAVQAELIGLVTALAGEHPGRPYNLIVCDGNVPQEGAALERALTDALPRARRVVHGQIDATLAVHLGPNLLGAGIQFLDPEC